PFVEVVEGHDARVLEARGDVGLALEAGARLGGAGEELLERDPAPEAAVARRQDPADAAAPDLALHVVTGVRRRAGVRRRVLAARPQRLADVLPAGRAAVDVLLDERDLRLRKLALRALDDQLVAEAGHGRIIAQSPLRLT